MSDRIERPELGVSQSRALTKASLTRRALELPLSPEGKIEYHNAILPHVQTARAAYQPLKEIRGSIQVLKQQEEQLAAQIKASTAPQFAWRHPLSSQLELARQTREALASSPETRLAEETFRLAANDFIAQVNQAKADIAKRRGNVLPQVVGLISQPQIPRPDSTPPLIVAAFLTS